MVTENVKDFLAKLPKTNPFGEPITLVAAVKTQSVEDINLAIEAGICHIGDNHVQEFRDKYDAIVGNPQRHFIGHLQTNKVKYLIGKTDLYHSVDRLSLAEEIAKRSAKADIVSDVLLQINAGNEESKGGFSFEEIEGAYAQIKTLKGVKIVGLMAMLPFIDDSELLKELATKVRGVYDKFKTTDSNFKYLSMGMSGDYALCIACGANTIRIGTTLFGKRSYAK